MSLTLKDALLQKTLTLPNGANTTTTTGLQIHSGATATEFNVSGQAEFLLEVPALTTGQLPDAQTVTYTLEHSDDDASYAAVTGAAQCVQTGAGGVGAVATSLRFRPASTTKKFIRAKAVKTGAADASAQSATLSLVF